MQPYHTAPRPEMILVVEDAENTPFGGPVRNVSNTDVPEQDTTTTTCDCVCTEKKAREKKVLNV